MDDSAQQRALRMLILLEGTKLSSPARQTLEFCRVSRTMAGPRRLKISVATFVRGDEANHISRAELFTAFAVLGINIMPIRERFRFDPRVLLELRKTVRHVNPDIIETNHVKSHFLVRSTGICRNSLWIAFHHGYTRDARRTWFYNQLDRWSLQAASRVITVCQPFRQQLVARRISPSRILVVHNAISPDWMQASGDSENIPSAALPEPCRKRNADEKIVLAIGRLSKEKAFADLLTAVAEIRRLYPDFPMRLLIAGEGPERASLERQIRRQQLQNRVALLGYVSDVRPLYRLADVVVLSSTSEGEPTVLLEALAAGVPAVATAVGGVPAMVEDRRSALLVPPGDPPAMASAIHHIFTDADLREYLVTNGRKLVASRYSPESRANLLLQAYQTAYRDWRNRS